MLEAHAPHHSIHTWKDFLIHIATIVVGLLIAVSLEQAVEYIHHRHQLKHLHEQLREVFENNLRLEPQVARHMGDFRDYLTELQSAVNARLSDAPLHAEPSTNDPRMKIFTSTPSLAPYDAAKTNGTIALLTSDEIRMYNRIDTQRAYLMTTIANWFNAILEMEVFEQQFTNSRGNLEVGDIVATPELSHLSSAELLEYRRHIARVSKTTDIFMTRVRMLDAMCRAVLDGAHDENQILQAVGKMKGIDVWDELRSSPHR